jgi:hypothetical protein
MREPEGQIENSGYRVRKHLWTNAAPWPVNQRPASDSATSESVSWLWIQPTYSTKWSKSWVTHEIRY